MRLKAVGFDEIRCSPDANIRWHIVGLEQASDNHTVLVHRHLVLAKVAQHRCSEHSTNGRDARLLVDLGCSKRLAGHLALELLNDGEEVVGQRNIGNFQRHFGTFANWKSEAISLHSDIFQKSKCIYTLCMPILGIEMEVQILSDLDERGSESVLRDLRFLFGDVQTTVSDVHFSFDDLPNATDKVLAILHLKAEPDIEQYERQVLLDRLRERELLNEHSTMLLFVMHSANVVDIPELDNASRLGNIAFVLLLFDDRWRLQKTQAGNKGRLYASTEQAFATISRFLRTAVHKSVRPLKFEVVEHSESESDSLSETRQELAEKRTELALISDAQEFADAAEKALKIQWESSEKGEVVQELYNKLYDIVYDKLDEYETKERDLTEEIGWLELELKE